MGNMVSKLYRVKKGDTVLSICKTHNLNWPDFVKMNPQFDEFGTRDPSLIYNGEMFVVGFVHKDVLEMVRKHEEE